MTEKSDGLVTGYAVSEVLPAETIDTLDPGTNVVVVGPSMSGKRSLALELLAAGYEDGEGILCITTTRTKRIYDDLKRYVPSLEEDRIGVVDCSGSESRSAIEQMTESVPSPGDLTGISIGTAKLFKQFNRQGISDIRYGLISVSTLLQYIDINTVFKFLHIYTNRVSETDGLGIYTLNDDTHEEQTVNTIKGQFDVAVTLRETETGDLECQVRGAGSGSRGWHPID
ncbi:RAD55 family ATPase [Halovivax limisalsi]|uniref:RAD55 family ATPase n=1 Tax=Halovivax limisalsi TaxID=1453760 RepID=UPI001FFC3F65|nr:hypothetical protein [Halovivax limisalsi]